MKMNGDLQLNGPYSVELVKQATGQGKIFVRSLQCDISMDEVERAINIVRKHICMYVISVIHKPASKQDR